MAIRLEKQKKKRQKTKASLVCVLEARIFAFASVTLGEKKIYNVDKGLNPKKEGVSICFLFVHRDHCSSHTSILYNSTTNKPLER